MADFLIAAARSSPEGEIFSRSDQEAVGSDRHGAVVMETSPCAPLVMAEADFLLEVLIITLDSPAQLGEIDEVAERHVGVDRREPELCGRSFMHGPFDQECLFGKSRFT